MPKELNITKSKPIQVCFLTSNLDIKSGWGRYSFEIISRIEKNDNFESVVLVESASSANNEFAILPDSAAGLIDYCRSVFAVRKFVRSCDIVHCLDGWPYGVIAALASFGLGKKIIINAVGTFSVSPLYQPIKKILLAWAYKKADRILCISRFTLNEIAKKVKLNNLSVINLGVDFDKFSVITSAPKEVQSKMILSVGALKSRKGFQVSIPAVTEAIKKYPDLRYYIVGSQSDKKYFNLLQELIDHFEIKENVLFFDDLSDEKLLELYHQTDLFLLTPVNIGHNFEGFGLVYLEAGACGKPVIGTLDCGAEDAIIDGITGLLVPQNDISLTAKAILKILSDNELSKELGNNGRKRARNMDWNEAVNKYIEVYQSSL